MNDIDDIIALGPRPATQKARRLSDPGPLPDLQTFPEKPALASRRQSDPGRGFSVFALRVAVSPTLESKGTSNGHRLSFGTSSASQSFLSLDNAPLDTPTRSATALAGASRRDTLRPGTQMSAYSGSDGRRRSYAETSSATQSFVSLPDADTPTHSTAALSSTASDAGAGARMRQESPARNATMRATQGTPTRMATSSSQRQPTLAPQASGRPGAYATPNPVARDASSQGTPLLEATRRTDHPPQREPISAHEMDPAAHSPYGQRTPQRQAAQEAAYTGRPRETVMAAETGRDDTFRYPPEQRTPQGRDVANPAQQDRREAANLYQRREPHTGASGDPTHASYTGSGPRASSESAPRRSFKVSETPTVVPNKPNPFRGEDHVPPPIQESQSPSRPRLPSGASNRSGSATAASASPSKPSFHPRHDEKSSMEPRHSSSARPSTATSRPGAKPEKPTREPPPFISAARPRLPPGESQMGTRYVNMLLAVDTIPSLFNLLASFFTWILLAGFVLFPGTFTNLKQNSELGALGITAVNVVNHVSLYVIAWVCTGIGAAGMCYLWYRWRGNYIWLVNRIFMPGLLNSLAGILSTLSSVLGTQNATLSIASKSTIIVTSAVAGICGLLTAFYLLVLIRNLKKEHDAQVGKQRSGKHGEGYADTSKRKNPV